MQRTTPPPTTPVITDSMATSPNASRQLDTLPHPKETRLDSFVISTRPVMKRRRREEGWRGGCKPAEMARKGGRKNRDVKETGTGESGGKAASGERGGQEEEEGNYKQRNRTVTITLRRKMKRKKTVPQILNIPKLLPKFFYTCH